MYVDILVNRPRWTNCGNDFHQTICSLISSSKSSGATCFRIQVVAVSDSVPPLGVVGVNGNPGKLPAGMCKSAHNNMKLFSQNAVAITTRARAG